MYIAGTDGGEAALGRGSTGTLRPSSAPRVMSCLSWQLWHVGMTPADLSDTKCVKATRGSCLTSVVP